MMLIGNTRLWLRLASLACVTEAGDYETYARDISQNSDSETNISPRMLQAGARWAL